MNMCDTVVSVSKDGVWLAKNSDREPGESQVVEHLPRRKVTDARVRCTHVEVPASPARLSPRPSRQKQPNRKAK